MKLRTLIAAGLLAAVLGVVVGYAATAGYQHGKAAALADAKAPGG